MDIIFNDHKLQRICNDPMLRVKHFGKHRAQTIRRRLDDLRAARSLEDMRNLPGKCHELTGDRKGQFSVKLDGPYVLVFESGDYPRPIQGGLDHSAWSQIRSVIIKEIVDYHG
jgi:plasmid maintenance system killer protein